MRSVWGVAIHELLYFCPDTYYNLISERMKIAVAGMGYVGLSVAVLLAQHHEVVGVDVLPDRVDLINQHQSPIQDDYLEEYLATRQLRLRATLDAEEAYQGADFVVVATPTNYDPVQNFFNTSAVEAVVSAVRADRKSVV